MINLQDRPPHVRFEYRPIEDRQASIQAGHVVYRDVEFAVITPIGGTLSVEKECTQDVIKRFAEQYKAWKAGEDAPINGSPLKLWPPVTPAFLQQCLAMEIRAVEDLAAANEQVIDKLGPGARSWKEKARVWLESAATHGKPAEEIAALKVRLDQLEADVKEKDETIRRLRAELGEDEPRKRGRPRKDAA